MKVGVIPINIGVQAADQVVQTAQLVESLGYESVWTFEHVIVPVDYESKYPYNKSGNMGAAPETNFVDPLIALAAVAAATTTLRLATGVNILSQANPIYMAKQAASLDFISNGRFMLGVGIGWLREEFDALGVPFERRGASLMIMWRACAKYGPARWLNTKAIFCHGQISRAIPCPYKARSLWLWAVCKEKYFSARPSSAMVGSRLPATPQS